MRTIINYIRTCFCKHEFKFEEVQYEHTRKIEDGGSDLRSGARVSRTCIKCGWHTAYWKH